MQPRVKWPADKVERVSIARLVPYARNARTHSEEQVGQIAASIKEWGWTVPVLVDEDGGIIAGHGRVLAALKLGLAEVPAMTARGWTEAQKRAYVLADNKLTLNGGWDEAMLADELRQLVGQFDVSLIGFAESELAKLLQGAPGGKPGAGSLAGKFMVPPLSVLNAREGWWQDRKRAWIDLGIRSEIGRGAIKANGKSANLTFAKSSSATLDAVSTKILDVASGGTSVFDPVLCELTYRWFCPSGGVVLDPFAGGSVRGIVAAKLGRPYVGIDLRPEQVAANQEQAAKICGDGYASPTWNTGDSAEVLPGLEVDADLVFSCPPYGDLEVYSDLPADLSNMPRAEFMAAYRAIIAAAVDKLKPDRFACFVVGDFRDGKGFYRNFVSDTIAAFEDAGARLYNEAVLVTVVGSLAVRVGKQFRSSRKLGKSHQNVLVFVKGDPRKATAACGPVEIDDSMFAGPPGSGEP
jgi:hypothetical protein